MFRRFDADKTVQAIAVIVRAHRGETASKLRILKLLYIADRESIEEIGYPILGCRTVAMDHGPLHSDVENLIDGEHIDEPKFSSHFSRFGYMIETKEKDPGVGRLSRYEIEKLREVSNRYASVGDWELAHEVTHQFKEWLGKYEAGTSKIIPLEDIVDAVGRSADKDEIILCLKNEYNADAAFGARSL